MEDGVLIIDKPAGWSSAQVVSRVKKGLRAGKVGHAGTLDPFATGVLVCLVNRATRLAQFFLKGEKTYEAELCLGTATDTQDATGRVVAVRPVPDMTSAQVGRVFERFVGAIRQKPPAYSALKHQGVALYKLARRGCPVQKPARQVRIMTLTIHEIRLPNVRFSVTCSGGTYIRTLCADIGRAIGCGGHLRQLRRTRSSGFGLEEAISLETLASLAGEGRPAVSMIAPGEALKDMPVLRADPPIAAKIRSGGIIAMRDFTDLPTDATVMNKGEKGTHYKILDTDNRLIAVVVAKPDRETFTYCGVFA